MKSFFACDYSIFSHFFGSIYFLASLFGSSFVCLRFVLGVDAGYLKCYLCKTTSIRFPKFSIVFF